VFWQVTVAVLAADSPAGRVAVEIHELTSHLPSPEAPWECPLCSTEWPCRRFGAAAHELMQAGLRLPDWVPYELHPRLWPANQAEQPLSQPMSSNHDPQSSTWFTTKEQDDG
jgi:hypothetical protein